MLGLFGTASTNFQPSANNCRRSSQPSTEQKHGGRFRNSRRASWRSVNVTTTARLCIIRPVRTSDLVDVQIDAAHAKAAVRGHADRASEIEGSESGNLQAAE